MEQILEDSVVPRERVQQQIVELLVPQISEGAARVWQVSLLMTMKSLGTTTSAGPLKLLDRIGQVKWWRSFSRIGGLGERH